MPVTAYSTTAASNNGAAPNGAPEGMAPSGVNDVIRQIMADIALEAQTNNVKVLKSVAGTNTITADMDPELAAYVAGMIVIFTPANTNTGATTIAIDGLAALDIQKGSGSALVAGDLVAGIPALLMLDAGADDFILVNPQAGGLFLYKAFKASNTSRSTTITLADDPDLAIAIVAGTYKIEAYLSFYAAGTGAGIQLATNFTGTTTNSKGFLTYSITAFAAGNSGTINGAFIGSAGISVFSATQDWALLKGTVTVSTSGTYSIQWAQNASSGNSTTLGLGSYLILERLA